MKRLYLDLDGVLADFDAAFPAVFGLDHKSMADDAMWEKINGHPSFFRDLPPMPGALEFFKSVEHLNPIILTACPKTNYANAATQKIAWVREHLSKEVLVMPVMGGKNKPLFMHAKGDILIDDYARNCIAWAEAGGVPIKHNDFPSTEVVLRELMARAKSWNDMKRHLGVDVGSKDGDMSAISICSRDGNGVFKVHSIDRAIIMPTKLTAENGAKAALSGEIKQSVNWPCGLCAEGGEGADDDCPECNGEGTIVRNLVIDWDTIKKVYVAAVAHFYSELKL